MLLQLKYAGVGTKFVLFTLVKPRTKQLKIFILSVKERGAV